MQDVQIVAENSHLNRERASAAIFLGDVICIPAKKIEG